MKFIQVLPRLFTLIYLSTFFFAYASNSESIKNFHSDITIHDDGTLDVVETIVYVNKDLPNKHGIIRDFPTSYQGAWGTHYTVPFKVKDVFRNGNPEVFTTESIRDGVRVNTGDDTVIPPGVSSYTIAYETSRQIGFFADYDMLYWNVTGNGWPWMIERASASIHLPKSIPLKSIKTHAFTGEKGERGNAYTVQVGDDHTVSFKTTHSLPRHQGLTFQVSWPKGFISEPTIREELSNILWDNWSLMILLIVTFISISWYLRLWLVDCREEKLYGGPVHLCYDPPADLSAGELGFILKKGYRANQFAAEVVDMAVKGLIAIEVEQGSWSDTYSLTKQREVDSSDLALHGEMMKKLFKKQKTVEFSKNNSSILMPLSRYIDKIFSEKCKRLIKSRLSHFVILEIVSSLALILFLFNGGIEQKWVLAIAYATVIPHIFGFFLTKTYYPAGIKLKNQILGFKKFLDKAEFGEEYLRQLSTTELQTLYEKYLPCSISLGVDVTWSGQFINMFNELDRERSFMRPVWYRSNSRKAFNPAVFSSTLGSSLQSAVTSSGGGGFGSGGSGGGRGGGGGGSR